MNCPDCESVMDDGFLPEVIYGANIQTHWHSGVVEQKKRLGMDNGIKVDARKTLPITACRCPKCGLVRLYAFARNE